MTTKELEGIAHELAFWMRFTKEDRFLSGWVPTDQPTPELHPVARDVIKETSGEYAHRPVGVYNILDVGSGVTSLLNGFVHKDDLIATDPLAGLYRLIFDYHSHNLRPPFAIPAEELTENGFSDRFDLVHCSNALDHTQNPSYALEEMMDCCRQGGRVMIQGFENEGQHEQYAGFHQWNINMIAPATLYIQGKSGVIAGTFEGDPQYSHILPIPSQKRNWYIWISRPKE